MAERLWDKYKGNWEDFEKSAEFSKVPKGKVEDLKKKFEAVAPNYATAKNAAKAMSAGITNDKGESSIEANPVARAVVRDYDKKTLVPDSQEAEAAFKSDNVKNKNILKEADGKSVEEQKDIAFKNFPEQFTMQGKSPVKPEEEKPELSKKEYKEVTEAIDEILNPEETTETQDKKSAYIKAWAATHPSWVDFLKSKDVTFAQKAQLIGSLLANVGANVTLGAKSGFEHGGFTPVEWDFKKGMDKYFEQEIDKVLGSEQSARAKETYANYFSDLAEKYGDEKMQEIFSTLDTYGDNPAQLKERLEALGIKEDAETMKKAYAKREKVSVEEQTKRDKIDTDIKATQARIQRLQEKITDLERQGLKIDTKTKAQLQKSTVDAQKAINAYNKVKYNTDMDYYKFEKVVQNVSEVLGAVEGVATAAVDVATGGAAKAAATAAEAAVKAVKDGIIKSAGVPQKIVRADGTEIALDPHDNIYATKKGISTAKDDGSAVVPMSLKDEIFYQDKLGYNGGIINKDFDYYLKKLGGM